MIKKYSDLIGTVTNERKYLDDKVKATKYARPGYNYVEAHTKSDQL